MAPIPKQMSGILIEKVGGPEVLTWKENLLVPELKEGEVLVKNEFIGVNYIETYFRTGLYKAELPWITGKEGAGTVAAFHPSVKGYKEGDRVVYLHEHSYAQYTAVPAFKLMHIPDGITTETAAASYLQGLTGVTLIKEAAGIKKPALGVSEGEWVLVHAAAGGTGSQLVQMLVTFGAKIIGTAGGPEKRELAKKNGAAWVLDSKEDDIVARVNEITGGHGADVIFDGIGKATFDKDFDMIARNGRLVLFGYASGMPAPLDYNRLGVKNIHLTRPVSFNYLGSREYVEEYAGALFELLLSGKVKVQHTVYPLKEVAKAHTDLESRKTTGKLVLKV